MKLKLIALAVTGMLGTLSYAAEPDTQVIEFYHPELKHYFITASASDARIVDSGGAGPGWVRTSRSFGAWSSRDVAPVEARMVYRFYSASANSHVYVASDDDLRLLNGLEAKERAQIAGTNKILLGWGLEGEAFLTVLPVNGQCPAATQAITRIYNNGFVSGEGSNHRYVADTSLTASMEDRAWKAEGTVFCAPLVSGAAIASVSTAASSAAASAASYAGNVTFKYEETGKPQVKSRAMLTLALAADGALTGSSAGCNMAGSVAATNASTTLRSGSLIASSCTDARFNGTYRRVEIEQFGAKAIDIRFRLDDGAKEASIEGVLNNTATTSGTAPTTPPTTPPAPVPPNIAIVAGDFAGILSVLITERPAGQPEKVVLNVNQAISLKVSSTGTVSGAVQGCAISGTVMPDVNNRFVGTISLAGCTEARLNGSYTVAVHLEDGGAIEAELEREVEQAGVRIKVSIEGNLARSASTSTTPVPPSPTPTTPPTTPPTGLAIAGSFAGNASFLATRRPAGGREATEVDKSLALTLTVGSNGSVSGTGAGCRFSGNLAVTNAALGSFGGSIVASGCTDAIINGTYTASATREDASRVEFELERESEISGERVKVKIKGTLSN